MKYTLINPTLKEIDGIRETMPKIRSEWYGRIPGCLDMIATKIRF